MKRFLFMLMACVLTFNIAAGQSLAINITGAAANSSSILDVSSTSKGVLVPRMTKAQKNVIASPAAGLLVYQSAPDSIGFHYYNSSQWVWLNPSGTAGNDWSITGNTGTDTAVNFIGTSDNMPIRLKQNNVWIGQLNRNNDNYFIGELAGKSNTAGVRNVAIGTFALLSNTTGSSNIAIGTQALGINTTGNSNVAIGDSAAYNANVSGIVAVGNKALLNNTTGIQNAALGESALYKNSTGFRNTGIGYNSLSDNTVGSFNTAIGSLALSNNTTGNNNTAIGQAALFVNTTGSNNTAIGNNVMSSNLSGAGNIAIGPYTMFTNSTGNNNVVIGNQAAYNSNVSDIVAVGTKALFSNTTGTELSAIGDSALYSNTTGDFNTAVGSGSLKKNTTGFDNVAFGNKALYSTTTGSSNTAIGNNALFSNILGLNNTALGYGALNKNISSSNTAVGYNALSESTTGFQNIAVGGLALQNNAPSGNYNVAIGFGTLQDNSGIYNIGIGTDALSQVSGNANIGIGHQSLWVNTSGQQNIGLGYYSLRTNATGRTNIAIGGLALFDNTTGSYNIAIGDSAAYNSNVSDLVAIGSKALWNNTSGTGHTAIGYHSLFSNTTGSNNTAIGNQAGQLNNGSGNVFIGYNAGASEAGSNKLYIENSNSATPLIYGDFSTNLLRVNGTLNINNDYSFPIADGLANQVLRTDGIGNVSWAAVSGESTTANNGLTLTGSNVALGGSFLNNTTITQGNFNLTHHLSGSGDFLISTLTNNPFTVLDNGNVGINTNTPLYKFHMANSIGGLTNLSNSAMIQNTNAVTTGQATLAFKNTGPAGLPGNRAWITGMNAFDNYVIAYGDSLTGSNAIVRVDTAGYVGVNPNGFPTSRLDVVGSFGSNIKAINSNQTLNEDDHTIIVSAGTGAITIILPAAATCERREYVIVNRTGTDKTISPAYNDFSGSSSIAPANASITLQSNGTNWFRIH